MAYKVTQIYYLVQNIILGVVLANTVIVALNSIYTRALIPITSKGDYVLIIAVVWGLLHYTFFSNKYRPIYRQVILIAMALTIAQRCMGNLDNVFTFSAGLVQYLSQNPMLITNMIIAVLAFLYWLYWKPFNEKFKTYLRPPRYLFRYAIATWCGWSIGQIWCTEIVNFTGLALDTLKGRGAGGLGMYVVLVMAIGILIDVVIGWNKILGVRTSREPTTTKA